MKLSFALPILLIFIGVQIAATLIAAPTIANDLTAFGDPQSMESPFIYLGLVILMTAVLLLLFKYGWGRFVKWFFLLGVWSTLYFVTSITALQMTGTPNLLIDSIAFIIPIIGVILIWKFPEWYVIDILGFLMCAGATAILGSSFGVAPVLVLMVIFAVYDAISVYKTKHMLTLAQSILTQKLPALFIIPRTRDFSYLDEKTWTDLDDTVARPAYIIGMGDIIIPSALVVSASMFLTGTKFLGVFTLPALGAMVGSWIGFLALQLYADRHPQSHAGLPFLNSFTIVGFLVAYGITVLMG